MTQVHDPYAETFNPAEEKPASKKFRISPFGIVIIVMAVLLVAVVSWGIYRSEQTTLRPGDDAPNFDLKLYDGDELELAKFKGDKVVVINFWQSNCAPCHEEAPMLVRVAEEYADQGVVFIGVNAKDPDRLALDYLAQYDITYPNGLDIGDEIQAAYRTTGYPETFIIDRDGVIRKHFPGPPSEIQLRNEIDAALAAS